MDISVIIPVYNGSQHLRMCLESVVNQTHPPSEIIVINDGSTDNSSEIIKSYSNIKLIDKANEGVAAARNEGIRHSKSDWISFIDQDDYWTEHSLRKRAEFAANLQFPDLVVGKQKWFLDGIDEIPSWVKPEQMNNDLDGYLLGCALLRKNLFQKFGEFDSSFRYSSDFDWFFRLKDGGIEFNQLDEVVLMKRIHSENESRHAQDSLKELSRAIFNSINRKRKLS